MGAASVRDVAARAGVSVGTVSNVLNQPGKVASTTVARVQAAIDELGFIRNDAARQLRAGYSRSIGLIVLDVGNPFFTDLARGVEKRAEEAGLAVLLGNSDESPARESAYLDLFEQQRVHGVLITPNANVSPRLERLRARGIPSVIVDRIADDRQFSSVSMDDVSGGRMAVEHLLTLGRRRIAFISGSRSIRQVADRLAGAREAVAAQGGATLEVVEIPTLTVIAGRKVGEALAVRPPATRPDAIFAANDLVAIGVLQALVMQGDVQVPDDIAIIGYDDIAFAAAAVVPLSSIRQPSREIGATATQVLLDEAANPVLEPRQVVFQPQLMVRSSTRSVAPQALEPQ